MKIQAKPATGTTRLVKPVGESGKGGEVTINKVLYSLSTVRSLGVVILSRVEEGVVISHYLPYGLTGCTCEDSKTRERDGGCKHQKALRALQERGQLVLPAKLPAKLQALPTKLQKEER